MRESKTLLFLKKKKQKDFRLSPDMERPKSGRSNAAGNESFLLLFFKKEALACLAFFFATHAAAAAPSISVSKPWLRYLLPSIPAAGYMTVRNDGDVDAILTGASSPSCGMLMLHKSEDSSGMAMMMDMQTITIPAHGSVTFQPGGYHLMCMSPDMKLGDKVNVTLSFQDGSTTTVSAPVYGAQNSP